VITAAQGKAYIDQTLGASVPDFLIDVAIAKVSTYEPAMAAVYDDTDIVLMQCLAVAIIACPGSPKRTSSQHAASGASRSYKFGDDDMTALRRSLATLDTQGLLRDAVGVNPTKPASFVYVV
jgi:hypothetical protein